MSILSGRAKAFAVISISVLIVFVETAAFMVCDAHGAASETPTKVTGLKKSYKMTKYDKTITDKIKVSPAYGRKVTVSFYDESLSKWVKYKSFKTKNKKTSEIKIEYPYYWKQHYITKFRVKIPEKTIVEKDESASSSKSSGTDGQSSEEPEGILPDENITIYSGFTKKITVTNNFLPGAASCVMDATTGEVIAERNMNERRKIASVTKMMTGIILVESGKLKKKTKMTKEAANTRWALGLKKGDKLKGSELLNLMMVGSCNEAAAQAGILASGSTKKYIKAAHKKAAELGAFNTLYGNAHGIDVGNTHGEGNYSTAYDQALIGSYIMTAKSMKPIRNAVLKKRYYVKRRGRYIGRANTNYLLGKDGNIGLKTGTERTAGNCFVGAYKYNGRTYVTVVLGSATSSSKWTATVNLKNYMKYSVAEGYKNI